MTYGCVLIALHVVHDTAYVLTSSNTACVRVNWLLPLSLLWATGYSQQCNDRSPKESQCGNCSCKESPLDVECLQKEEMCI